MTPRIANFILEGRSYELVEEDIYSVLDNTPRLHQYDKKAAVYDLLVGSRIYNRLLWGTSPDNHAAFASTAVNSHSQGLVLDAGCGSLVFAAKAHLGCSRQIVACDQSLDMLRRARARLMKLGHAAKRNIVLVQADLNDLPFRANIFQTILCMNVLHHASDAASLTHNLRALLTDRGHLYLTSLVLNNRLIGDQYLSLLHKKGWIVRPRSVAELKSLIEGRLPQSSSLRTEGNMAYIKMADACTVNC